jgi:hypothetical protein
MKYIFAIQIIFSLFTNAALANEGGGIWFSPTREVSIKNIENRTKTINENFWRDSTERRVDRHYRDMGGNIQTLYKDVRIRTGCTITADNVPPLTEIVMSPSRKYRLVVERSLITTYPRFEVLNENNEKTNIIVQCSNDDDATRSSEFHRINNWFGSDLLPFQSTTPPLRRILINHAPSSSEENEAPLAPLYEGHERESSSTTAI